MGRKDILIGFCIGLVSAIVGALLYATISGMVKGFTFQEVMTNAVANNIVSKLFSLGAVLNLGVFFAFLRKRKDNKAKGVLMATLLIALISMVNKLF